MKEVYNKLAGIEPMSADNKECICLLPVVALWFFVMMAAAVVLG